MDKVLNFFSAPEVVDTRLSPLLPRKFQTPKLTAPFWINRHIVPWARVAFLAAPLGLFAGWCIYPALTPAFRAQIGLDNPPAVGTTAWMQRMKEQGKL